VFGSNKQKSTNRIDSLIGLETRIQGDMTFTGGLRIDGEVVGDVTAHDEKQSTLMVSEKARIRGTVRVGHMVLNGTVEGPIHASHFLELQSKCHVHGDVYYSTLEMHPGAVVVGQLIHVAADAKKGSAPAPVPAAISAPPAAPALSDPAKLEKEQRERELQKERDREWQLARERAAAAPREKQVEPSGSDPI
jgi:cytoskeletal protein CcmA (bactofilin family)